MSAFKVEIEEREQLAHDLSIEQQSIPSESMNTQEISNAIAVLKRYNILLSLYLTAKGSLCA